VLPDNVVNFPTSTEDDGAVGLPLVAPGTYTATYVRHECLQLFGAKKIRVLFRLLEHAGGVELERWYPVKAYKPWISAAKRASARPPSVGPAKRARPSGYGKDGHAELSAA
jgi:hypothetical protein